MAPDTASVPDQGQELTGLNKKVSELISADTKIRESGAVTGTLKYVKGWNAFNPSDPSEQSGYYMPVKLGDEYQGQEITVTGTKQVKAQDTEWVLFVKDSSSTFKFESDGKEIMTLTFKGTNFQPQTVSYSANSPTVKKTANRKKTAETE